MFWLPSSCTAAALHVTSDMNETNGSVFGSPAFQEEEEEGGRSHGLRTRMKRAQGGHTWPWSEPSSGVWMGSSPEAHSCPPSPAGTASAGCTAELLPGVLFLISPLLLASNLSQILPPLRHRPCPIYPSLAPHSSRLPLILHLLILSESRDAPGPPGAATTTP